jgi:hypothetical protein
MLFLQIGMNGPLEAQDKPDSFYLAAIEKTCAECGMGEIIRVRGKVVWPMGSYFPDDSATNHVEMESLQGKNGLFLCGDYMFATSMSTSMAYAAGLAKKMGKPSHAQRKPTSFFRALMSMVKKAT